MRTDGPLVIALDGSPHSAQTLAWGLAEATIRGADVLLARVFEEPHNVAQWGRYPMVAADLGWDVEAKQYLADQLDRESALHPTLALETALLHGPAVPVLQELSKDAQLLVVGGSGHVGGMGIGSVSDQLAARSRCPVVIVRNPETTDLGAPVVVGVDGSPSSLDAARAAGLEAALRGVPLHVVRARPAVTALYGLGLATASFGPGVSGDDTDPDRDAVERAVADLRVQHPGLDVRLTVVVQDPAHAIVLAARSAQLVVVGSRGLGTLAGLLLGAVSRAVVRTAPVSVLVQHDGAAS